MDINNTEYFLEHHLHRNTSRSRAIYITVLLVLVLSGIVLPFIKVDVSVQGNGIIRPSSEKTEIKAPAADMVEYVFVYENQFVHKNTPILKLNTKTLEAKLQVLQFQESEAQRFLADLKVITGTTGSKTPDALITSVYEEEYHHFYEQRKEMGNKRDKAYKELLRNKQLFDNGVIAEKDFDDFRYQYTSADNEFKIYTTGQLSKWQADINKFTHLASETGSEIEQIIKEKEKYTIKAPVTGTIEQFTGIYQGSQLQEGQTVAVISPDSSLLSEVYISPKDIGYIKINKPVRIQVDAFNYNEWGMLQGKITEISSDFFLIDNKPMFRVRCTTDRTWLLLKNNVRGDLKKGMTVKARFLLSRRSLFQLLYEDIDDWINPTQYSFI